MIDIYNDGNWPENPCCPYCMDESMDEVEGGYICRFCDFYTEWDEEAGVWHDHPPYPLGLPIEDTPS